MRARVALLTSLVLAVGLVAGCGGASDDDPGGAPPEVNLKDFPAAQGRSLKQLLAKLDQGGPVLAPSVSELQVGKNRFGFGLFDRSRKAITNAPAVIYYAPVGGGPAVGPVKARFESLAVKPQFQSQTSARDPDSASHVYVADIDFPKAGDYDVIGMARLDNRLVAALPVSGPTVVKKESTVANVGDPAPVIHTPTPADVGGDLTQIDTRQPPAKDLHEVDFADVVGKKPIVLLFATPLLCQSRVCGPVADITEEVRSERGDDADFIHMEVYKDNTVDKGFRPQLLAWGLRSEPWLFTIDAQGEVAARLEGAFSVKELNAAVDAAVKR
ncbi:MAG: hypothetical protein JW895_00815 [Thermoleophilaceae bacterium]|nr:hypothetical protein [Thermoleophilaceae bacterium]